MKRYYKISVWFTAFFLFGCITEYEAKGIREISEILVVDGIITDDETLITLSRSVALKSNDPASSYFVNNADVYVECDDGTLFKSNESGISGNIRNGQYVVQTGKLRPEHKYRLKIAVPENHSSDDYYSDYTFPIVTPEIDSVFWTKKDLGYPVVIHIATHSPDNEALYYRWSYQEDWEIMSDAYLEPFPYYCWNLDHSRELKIGSAENTVFGRIIDILTEIQPSNRKIAELYRFSVKQNAISKRAYDYFTNIKKNSEQTGSIFAPVPSELRGNITCTTDPDKPAIGFVEVSTTTRNQMFISRIDQVYEFRLRDCEEQSLEDLMEQYELIPDMYVLSSFEPVSDLPGSDTTFFYIPKTCVDCTYFGTTHKPDDWPNNH